MDIVMALAGQGVGADALMGPLAIVAVLVAIGFFLILYRGSKIGWLFVAGALIYGWIAVSPIISRSGGRAPGAPLGQRR